MSAPGQYETEAERTAFAAGREYEGDIRDAHDAALSEADDTSWDHAVVRSICYELNAWGGYCSKPRGHRGVHVSDGGGAPIAYPQTGQSSTNGAADV